LLGKLLLLLLLGLFLLNRFLMTNEIEDSFGYYITLDVLSANFESLKELISLSQSLPKHLLVLLKRVENLIAKLLIKLHYEASLIVLVLYIIPQV
jgi:hypothetical protein